MRLKTAAVSLCLLLFTSVTAFAQSLYREAPEKWSMPVKVKELSLGPHSYASEPTLSADGRTIYCYYYSDSSRGGIYVARFQGNSWSSPQRLNDNVNQSLADGPSVSPDGRRLYFRMYGRADGYGGWDLYYSDWDTLMLDWGLPRNLGPNINQSGVDECACMTPDNRHLYMIRYSSPPRLSVWDSSTQSWGPTNWVDLFHFTGSFGRACATGDRRKIYYDTFVETQNPYDILVNYFDTLNMKWSDPMALNINKMMDTLPSARGKIQYAPWISLDGRTLYFASDHDSSMAIWKSDLLIDENGTSVSVKAENGNAVSKDFSLKQNYPNPFNSSTVIEYEISSKGFVELSVFDALGREIMTLAAGQEEPGKYLIDWNGKDKYNRDVPSGVYYCRMNVGQRAIARKMIVIK
jgi:flagellar hook assembly protein FlgD